MWSLINPEQSAHNYPRISQYENNVRVPSLREIWNYARLAKVPVEVLADDALNLTDSFYGAFRTGEADGRKLLRLPVTAPNQTETKEMPSASEPLPPPIRDNRRIADADTDDDSSVPDQRGAELPVPVGAKNKRITTEDKDNVISAQPDEVPASVVFTPSNETSEDTIPPAAAATPEITDGQFQKPLIEVGGELLTIIGKMYLELLPEISCDKWSQMPFSRFIGQMLRAAAADYEKRGPESAIAGRVRAVGKSAGCDAPLAE